jgi:hypothetical protein
MQHAIALLGDERVVCDDDADLVFADLLQGFKHALCGGFIEVRGGLIEHEDRAVIVENARQRDLAALTAGEIFALWLDLVLRCFFVYELREVGEFDSLAELFLVKRLIHADILFERARKNGDKAGIVA